MNVSPWPGPEARRRLDPLLFVLGLEILSMTAIRAGWQRRLNPVSIDLLGGPSPGVDETTLLVWTLLLRTAQILALFFFLRPDRPVNRSRSGPDRGGDLLAVAGSIAIVALGITILPLVARLGGFSPAWILGSPPAGLDRPAVLGVHLLARVVIGPIAEEAAFRGCLHPVLRLRLGAVPAVAANAILFGLVHLPTQGWTGASVTAAGGLLFATLYERRRRLWVPVLVHAGANGLLLLAT